MLSSGAVTDPTRQLADAIAAVDRGLILVVTGAGVSLASGIPTFRGSDPGAIWKRDLMELATLRYFREDPAGSWRWYLERFEKVLAARPNPAHLALAALERWQAGRGGRFLLVTQNVDTLHEKAGSRELIKVHGTADRVRCARVGCSFGAPGGSLARSEVDFSAFQAEPVAANLPRCPGCGSLLRQHVLWFDEYYHEHADYQFPRLERELSGMALTLFVGTSFSVGVTDIILRAALFNHIPVFAIDPGEPTLLVSRGFEHLSARAEEILPRVCSRLGIETAVDQEA